LNVGLIILGLLIAAMAVQSMVKGLSTLRPGLDAWACDARGHWTRASLRDGSSKSGKLKTRKLTV